MKDSERWELDPRKVMSWEMMLNWADEFTIHMAEIGRMRE